MSKMTIDSAFVGVPWKTITRAITWRDTTNYAAATNDLNPWYFDDERPEGIVAPPMFVVELGWPLIEKIHDYIDLPYPKAVFDQIVHYTTYIDIKRLIIPGVEVVVNAEIGALIPHRAGTECVFKFTVTDKEGNHFHTEYMGCMLRDVECVDGGKGKDNIPISVREKFEKTPEWEVSVPISKALPYIYDGCTGIVNPIHTSPRFAHSVNLPDPLLQGTVTIAVGVREVINRELGSDPRRVDLIGAKLTGMVFGGDQLKVQFLERRQQGNQVELFFQILNETTGKMALSYGYIKAKA
jgi:acyl dehydratase